MIRSIAVDEISLLRGRLVRLLAWATILVAALTLPATIVGTLQPDEFVRGASTNLILILLNGLCLVLLSRGQQQIAEVGVIIAFTVAALVTGTPFLLMATLALLAASVLGTTPVYAAVTIVILGRVVIDALPLIQASGFGLNEDLLNAVFVLASLAIMSVITRYFVNAVQPAGGAARRTANLLQASAEMDRTTSRLLDLGEILNQAVNILRTRLEVDHVQVYVVAESEDAVLTAAASDAGRELIARGHQVPLGSRNTIGQVLLSGNSMLRKLAAGDLPVSEDVFVGTRSQLVLPLRDGERLIAVLDLQSRTPNAFSPGDVQVLQVTADLLARAIRNIRLYEMQAQVAEENKRLYEQADANLHEIERLNHELTRTGWQEYMRPHQQSPGITLAENHVISDVAWTDTLLQAQQERRPVSRMDGEQPVVAVPITLRGEVIGAIEVEPGAQASGADAVEMVEAVAQRLAISLENARLYEETQKAAAQEQRINDIAARYQQVTTVDELLRVTLQELSESLGAERGIIRLGNIQEVGR
jgi:GAF domain-containing protein